MDEHYIVGYGSLICADSRRRTGLTGRATAILVQGLTRSWSMAAKDWQATVLNVQREPRSQLNAVFFPVDAATLTSFDQREYGYRRVPLDWSQVTPVGAIDLPSDSLLWVYLGNTQSAATTQQPIMQSYLDVVLSGCLSISTDFAEDFIDSTLSWQWLVDDRENPQYLRPINSTERLMQIDQLLAKKLPALYQQRLGRS